MRRFYLLLAVIAVAGAAFIYAASRGGAPTISLESVPPAKDGFTGFTLGSDSAPVEVVEYVDFECPICAMFATVQLPTIRDQLVSTGKLRWRVRDFPLSIHQYSRYAALVGQCAGEQGKFWPMSDSLFFHHDWALTGRDPSKLFRGFAQEIGLDMAKFDGCVEARRYLGRIQASYQEGEAAGVDGTPTFFLNGHKLSDVSTSDQFQALVDSLAKRGPARPATPARHS